jgi:hypothetical protein
VEQWLNTLDSFARARIEDSTVPAAATRLEGGGRGGTASRQAESKDLDGAVWRVVESNLPDRSPGVPVEQLRLALNRMPTVPLSWMKPIDLPKKPSGSGTSSNEGTIPSIGGL